MEKKKTNIGKNIIYQSCYQILAVITPLVTSPYVSRILGAEGLGEYTFVWTNALYFTLFAMLGVTNYGVRSIANVQNDIKKRSVVFWNIYTIQVFMTCLMLVFYLVYLALFVKGSKVLAFTQILVILSCFFDVNWYFFGVEKFKLTVVRNTMVKLFTVVTVLIFVNRNSGVMGYCIVMAAGTFVGNAVIVPFLKKEILFIKPTWPHIKAHIKPTLILFIPVLASSVFHIMDKTMLGLFAGKTHLGYYVNADKVINIPIGLVNGLGTVYLPRITAMRNEADEGQIREELYKSLELHSFIIFALSFGLASIAKEFVPLFFGAGFDPCILLIIVFAPAFIIKSYSNYVRTNILIPFNREKQYTLAVFTGALVNVVANSILIPHYFALGAVYGTVLAEISVFFVQLCGFPLKLSFNAIQGNTIPYFMLGVFMAFVIRIIACINLPPIFVVITEIFCGGVVFLIGTFLFWKMTKRENIIKRLICNKTKCELDN